MIVFFCPQVVSNRDTQETLLCAAFVFEVSNSEHGAQHHIYRLVKDWTRPEATAPAFVYHSLEPNARTKHGSLQNIDLQYILL